MGKRWKLRLEALIDPPRRAVRWMAHRPLARWAAKAAGRAAEEARERIVLRRRWKRNRVRIVLVFIGQVILFVFALYAVLAFIGVVRRDPWPGFMVDVNDRCQKGNNQACGVLTGIFFTVLPVIVGTAFLINRKLSHVRSRYRKRARRDPTDIVETAGNISGDIVGRDDVCNILQEDLRDPKRRRPQVLVGSVGTGKTAVLVQLTKLLARRGAVPVPIRLRDARGETIDFLEMARQRFCKEAEQWLGSDTDAEKVWRTLRQKGEIVILADGLEEALADTGWQRDRDHRVRAAVSQAKARGYPLVIASRPHDALKALDAALLNLEPLSEEAALSYIGAAATEIDQLRIAHVIERADVVETPLYMQIARDLNACGLLANTRGSDRVELRWRLMETWTDALINGSLAATAPVPLDSAARARTVLQLAGLACVGLSHDSLQVSFADWESECQEPEVAQLRTDLEHTLDDAKEIRLDSAEANESISRVEHDLLEVERDLEQLRGLAGNGNGAGFGRTRPGTVATARQEAPAEQVETPAADPAPARGRGKNLPARLDGWLTELQKADDAAKARTDGALASGGAAAMMIAASSGVRLDLVEHVRDGVRFPHSIMQAYLGSLVLGWALRDGDFVHRSLVNPGREFLVALIMYSRALHVADSDSDPLAKWRPKIDPKEREHLRDYVAGELLKAIDTQTDPTKKFDLLSAVIEIQSVAGPCQAKDREPLRPLVTRTWKAERNDDIIAEAKHKLIARLSEAARRAPVRGAGATPEKQGGALSAAEDYYDLLYDLACDEDLYTLRLAAAQELGRGGDAAFAALETRLWRRWLDTAESDLKQLKDAPRDAGRSELEAATMSEVLERRCVLQCWILPTLACTVRGDEQTEAVRHILGRWLVHVGDKMPLTIEAALAQGFKHAANRRPPHGKERPEERAARSHLVQEATDMIPRAQFWFSRMGLLQALGLWKLTAEVVAAADGDADEEAIRRDYDGLVKRWINRPDYQESHRFVQEAAELVVAAMKSGDPERYTWIDESGIVSKVGSRSKRRAPHAQRERWIAPSTGWIALDRRAQQLVADVLIALNLAERGATAWEREKRLLQISGNELPQCLVEKRCERLTPSRTVGMTNVPQPSSTCCSVGLCPYPPRGQQPFRVELSEAFCRNQQTILQLRRFGRPAGWQAPGRRELTKFWSQMERRART